MIPHERQQQILRLLGEQKGININAMARLLGVSRGTIRNDLLNLEEQRLVERVRGGALLTDEAALIPQTQFTSWPEAANNLDGKKRIARWAAELVQDGDAIFLGGGTTILQMVPFLVDKRDLTIVTNGLDTARALKKQSDHAIILLGGILLDHGLATGGLLNSEVFEHLNIHTAFLSGSGFSKKTRITESTLEEAELKKEILQGSLQTAILMDSSKLGKAGRFPFAELHDIDYFYTDSEVAENLKETIHAANVNLLVCGEVTVRSFTAPDDGVNFTIGFANESEESPFAVDVRRGLERAAADCKNVNLVIADNKLSGEEALRVADRLIARNVDLVVEYQIEFKTGSLIMDKFQQAKIPVIAVDIPMVGATFFGIDNYRAGFAAGEALGRWLQREWDGKFEIALVLEEPRAGAPVATRMQGQIDGLKEVLGQISAEKFIFLDSGNTHLISEHAVCSALKEWPDSHMIPILCFNSDATSGALQAVRKLNREQDVVIIGQGADRFVLREIRRPDSRIIGSTAYMPERYGPQILDLALKILAGEPVSPAVYTEHVFIDRENIDLYYPAA